MFSGLIKDLGSIVELSEDEQGARIVVSTRLAADLAEGDSIAVSGVCLTATRVEPGQFGAEVMALTLKRTKLGSLRVGDPVNLEPALRLSDRLGGHIVQGHVDGVGIAGEPIEDGFALRLPVTLPAELCRFVVERGSITLDGVSLTVAACDPASARLEVSLIPETQRRTTLGRLVGSDPVNLEVDVLARYVERLIGSAGRQ